MNPALRLLLPPALQDWLGSLEVPVEVLSAFGLVSMCAVLLFVHIYGVKRTTPVRAVQLGPDAAWRRVGSEVFLTASSNGVKTLPELFAASVRLHPARPCLGSREVLAADAATGKQTRGEFQFLTFAQASTRIATVGRALQSLGLGSGSRLAIYAATSLEWQLLAQACFQRGICVVTVYATLGEEALAHALNETEAPVVFADGDLVAHIQHLVTAGTLPFLRTVLYVGTMPSLPESSSSAVSTPVVAPLAELKVVELRELAKEKGLPTTGRKDDLLERLAASTAAVTAKIAAGGVRYVALHDLVDRVAATVPEMVPLSPTIGPSDVAVIIYTSGSTGLPKGCVISHQNLVAASVGCSLSTKLTKDDVYIGYLPLAHVLELTAEISVLAAGGAIGYSAPTLLTDESAGIQPGTTGDIGVLRPTIMAAVPAILERIRKGVLSKVARKNLVARTLFRWACVYKQSAIEAGRSTPIIDALIFRAVCRVLGGRLRAALSGGAPLAPSTQRFMNVVFCCPVGQGYGLTETCGAGTVCDLDDLSAGRAGTPVSSCEIKLVDWPEAGYFITDNPPRGEVVIAGPIVACGYFKQPEKSAAEFLADGFHTGDIGEMHADGVLRIIDRKKDLVKLQQGEYLSLGKVEALCKMLPWVDNMCVVANSAHPFCVAIVVPSLVALRELANQGEASLESLCENANVTQLALSSLQTFCRESKLQRFESPDRLTLVPDFWTEESGMVTAALKLKRKEIEKAYAADIVRMCSV